MEKWLPYIDFWAPYFISGALSLCMLGLGNEPLTRRKLISSFTLHFIIGGTLAPLLPLMSDKITKATQERAIAAGIGSRIIPFEKLLGKLIGVDNVRSAS